MSKGKKIVLPLLSTMLLTTSLVACSNSEKTGNKEKSGSDNSITIMTTTFQSNPPGEDSPVLKALEEYTDTSIKINWALNSSYQEKINITLASGDLPDIMMIPSKDPSFISAVDDGAFWELGPYLKDYPNLSQANEIVLNNSSIGGKIYGIYRSRPLGRHGISFRKDWLENVGLQTPKTVDDFYNMLKAFTKNDPDGNGKDDTYGMVISKYTGPWDIMQTWFGAPNKWGEDADGNLQPDFMTDEYFNALNFFKKLYDEGLINEDFAVMDPQKWVDPILNGQAGTIVDVVDHAHRIEEDMIAANPDLKDHVDVIGAVEGPTGLYNLPTSGYAGMLAIPKSSVKTEEELKKVLTFIDKLNDEEAQKIATNGIEGHHYEIKGGKLVDLKGDDEALINEANGFDKFIPSIPEERFIEPEQTPLRVKEEQIIQENEEIVVPNPAEALVSEVYAQKGQQLDNIINDARIKFIVGQIDEAGFKDAIELWRSSGGEDYIEEMNKLYKEVSK
ncbi:extracellular solute-binding protein [Metabacillus halosaccharovorans]|uniref:extracellular solute-binding protein n=1 Tax=Metabacillus halosaccharovorans TaxID=930124 RepID=UPI001C1F779B|nr:extracellular solute-binding protein [Metabacillus halosaccharovorans]MBU7591156.1 extracellular solute-binding protein [Metabacillus halosaccharovorans]